MRSKSVLVPALAVLGIATISLATTGGTAAATPGSGLTSTTLAQSTVPELTIKAHSQPADTWRLLLKTHGLTTGYVVDNVLTPGGTTGWHSHPGPSLIFVVRGAVTNYDSDDPGCAGQVYSAGSSFADPGGHDVHTLKNNGNVTAETIAVQLLPAGAPRRIDADAPVNCAS